jgi:RNA polymerase sigma factor (sigma-70 family)
VASIAVRESARVQEQPADAGGELIVRIASGDREALTTLYHRERQPLFAYLLHLTEDVGIAEEVLQDTFVAVWKSAGSFSGRSSARTWLIGIARRQAHNTLRRRSLPRASADIAAAEHLPGPSPEPEERAITAATRAEVIAAMAHLSPDHRQALVLAFVHDLSYQEMADILTIPVGTVKSRLNGAKRALKELLGTQWERT